MRIWYEDGHQFVKELNVNHSKRLSLINPYSIINAVSWVAFETENELLITKK